jgi:hypothetical protein
LCGAAENVSRIAVDLRSHVSDMDVNPFVVSETAAVAVDVLVMKRRAEPDQPSARGKTSVKLVP